MMPWRILWKAEALCLAVLVGCSGTPQALRVDHRAGGETTVHIPRTATVEPVEVSPEETTHAIRRLALEVRLLGSPRETVERLFQLDPLYGDYLYLVRERKLVPLASGSPLEGTLTEPEQTLVRRYKRWCRSDHGLEGDCLGGALVAGKYLDLQGRYMLAMALSKSPMLEEFERALGEMVSMQAVMQAAMATVVTLLVLLALPEPVTKFVAASATAALILWVGAKTLYRLITGWFQLMEEVKVATTFEEIREAGEKFGRVFSREAAQAFAMIAMALLAHTTKGFAEQVGTLPGSAQVSMEAGSRGSLLLSEVGAVESGDGDGRRLQRGAAALRGGDGGARWAQQPHGESPYWNHPERKVLVARRPVDPQTSGDLRQGGNASEGPGECRAHPGAQGAAPRAVPSNHSSAVGRRHERLSQHRRVPTDADA